MNINAISNNNYNKQSFGAIFKTKIDPKGIERTGQLICEGIKAVKGETVNGYCTAGKAGELADLYVFTQGDARILPDFLIKSNSKAMKTLSSSISTTGELPSSALKLDVVGFYKSMNRALDAEFVRSLPEDRIEKVSDFSHLYCSKLKP